MNNLIHTSILLGALALIACHTPDPLPHVVDPVVAQLSDTEMRDTAFRKIISWQRYRGARAYTEKDAESIRYHVICPQVTGPPLHAVFPDTNYQHSRAPLGHSVLIDADGAIIPYWIGDNVISGAFADINADGIVERVDVVSTGSECILFVLPITREQHPVLMVAFNRETDTGARWSWRLSPAATPGVQNIQLGPMVPSTRDIPRDSWPTNIEPAVTYSWSRVTREYEGDGGSPDREFLRVPTTVDWGSGELDAFRQRRSTSTVNTGR